MEKKKREELEQNAITKYEKGDRHYRVKYRPTATRIKCIKCGSVNNLSKYTDKNGTEFWFCKECIMQRARELSKETERE